MTIDIPDRAKTTNHERGKKSAKSNEWIEPSWPHKNNTIYLTVDPGYWIQWSEIISCDLTWLRHSVWSKAVSKSATLSRVTISMGSLPKLKNHKLLMNRAIIGKPTMKWFSSSKVEWGILTAGKTNHVFCLFLLRNRNPALCLFGKRPGKLVFWWTKNLVQLTPG